MNTSAENHPAELPRRVLFLNDVSFQYGAGVAQARQVEAMLSLGIETGVIAWAPGQIELEAVASRDIDPNLWLGIRDVDHLEGGKKLSDAGVIAGLLTEVARFNPEVVFVGNLHAAKWPLELLPALKSLGCRVVTFLHDAFLYTGRCAYPGDCRLYLTGCNATCPTADQYPKLAPERIADAWRLRRELFGGRQGIDVVANSQWNRRMFLAALPMAHSVETIELGANEAVFCPGDKRAARLALGLPDDKPIVICAAVNFQEERKGGDHLRAIVAALQGEAHFAALGHNADEIPGLTGLGYHLQAGRLAQIYQAGDTILDIGSGGRAAVVALRGALANPARTKSPLYFGLGADEAELESARKALVHAGLNEHAHLLTGSVAEFFQRWQVSPTMVYLHCTPPGTHLIDELKVLSKTLRPGTPVLLQGYLATTQFAVKSIRLAADQWAGEGHARNMGCFGESALYVTIS